MPNTGKSEPRLAPLPADLNPDLQDAFANSVRSLGFIPNSMLILQRKPEIVKALSQLGAAVNSPDGMVDRGFKRLIAHMASRSSGCQY
jgi:hypothetical protein